MLSLNQNRNQSSAFSVNFVVKSKKILGIDPGFQRMGYGLIEASGSKLKMLDYGSTETSKTKKIE